MIFGGSALVEMEAFLFVDLLYMKNQEGLGFSFR